jgi:hypothetical protein
VTAEQENASKTAILRKNMLSEPITPADVGLSTTMYYAGIAAEGL